MACLVDDVFQVVSGMSSSGIGNSIIFPTIVHTVVIVRSEMLNSILIVPAGRGFIGPALQRTSRREDAGRLGGAAANYFWSLY